MSDQFTPITRRKTLGTIAIAGAISLAGCGGGGSDSTQPSGETQSPATTNQTESPESSPTSSQPSSSVDFQWRSLAGDPMRSGAIPLNTEFRDLTHARDWGVGTDVTGFAATPDWFAVSINSNVRSGSMALYPLTEETQGWSASRLSPSRLSLTNGQIHIWSTDTYYQFELEKGDVVREFEVGALLDQDVQDVVLIDEQHAYVLISGGIAAVDHTSDPVSVSWTRSDLEHEVNGAIRIGEYVIANQGLGGVGTTSLTVDSGQTAGSNSIDGTAQLIGISTGAAGTYALLIEGNSRSLVRIDQEDLSVLWKTEDVNLGAAQPKIAVGSDVILASPTRDGLVALEASDGTVRWSVRGRILSPSISKNAAYGYGNSLLGIEIDSGEVVTEAQHVPVGTQILATVPVPRGAFVVTNETVALFTGN